MTRLVMNKTMDKTMAATHSRRSCPYGCSLSALLEDSLIPIMTINVLNTSDAEWIASLIIALECAITPAKSFMTDNIIFPIIVTIDTLFATF